MRILVIEDEPKPGDYLRNGLTEHGFSVDLARTGIEGPAGNAAMTCFFKDHRI